MARSYSYSVLQVIPDQRRGERVNIGVVVFAPDGIDVRILPSLQKVHALNANIDLEQFEELPATLANWVSSIKGVSEKHTTLKQFGIVTVSDLGFFECDESQYEGFVANIMNTLVKSPPIISRGRVQGRVHTVLKRYFRNQNILGASLADIDNHLVVQNFPIAENENLYADFAFKNGAYQITETINYRVRSGLSTDKFEETGLKAIKLHKAKSVFGKNTKRFLVYAADSRTERQLIPHLNLLGDYSDHVINLSSKQDRERYLTDIAAMAGSTRPI